MPNASVRTAATVNPGVLRSWRHAKRRSNAVRSMPRAPRPSRIASLCDSTLPNARLARRRASVGGTPRRACFSASISMWKRISSSSSRSTRRFAVRAWSHITSRLVPRMSASSLSECSCRPQQLLDREHVPPPALRLGAERLFAERREAVVLGAPVVVGDTPFAVDPFLLLEALEGRIEGALVDLEDTVGHLLDALGDAPAVHRGERERAKDEEVDGAAERLVGGFTHSCHSERSGRRPRRRGILGVRTERSAISDFDRRR